MISIQQLDKSILLIDLCNCHKSKIVYIRTHIYVPHIYVQRNKLKVITQAPELISRLSQGILWALFHCSVL